MRALLDTHALLWFHAGDRRLSKPARTLIENREAELVVSAASVWEMAIKAGLGRLHLPTTVNGYIGEKVRQGYQILPISAVHAARVEELPWHHRDLFDRLLAAQALTEGCPMITRDRVFRKYGVEVIW